MSVFLFLCFPSNNLIVALYSFVLKVEIAARGNAQSAWHGRLVQDFARELGADPTAGKVATVETGDGFSCTVDVDKLHVNVAVLRWRGMRRLQVGGRRHHSPKIACPQRSAQACRTWPPLPPECLPANPNASSARFPCTSCQSEGRSGFTLQLTRPD